MPANFPVWPPTVGDALLSALANMLCSPGAGCVWVCGSGVVACRLAGGVWGGRWSRMGQKEKHAITQAEYNKAAVHVLLRLAVTAPGCSTRPKVWCWHSSGSSSLVVALAQTACEHVFVGPCTCDVDASFLCLAAVHVACEAQAVSQHHLLCCPP